MGFHCRVKRAGRPRSGYLLVLVLIPRNVCSVRVLLVGRVVLAVLWLVTATLTWIRRGARLISSCRVFCIVFVQAFHRGVTGRFGEFSARIFVAIVFACLLA